MYEAVQFIAAKIGASGCYLACLKHIGEIHGRKPIDIVTMYQQGITGAGTPGGTPTLSLDCYVYDPAKLLGVAAGGEWEVEKQGPTYEPKAGEYIVHVWERKVGFTSTYHFTVAGIDGGQEYDPLGDSITRTSGILSSVRVIRPKVEKKGVLDESVDH